MFLRNRFPLGRQGRRVAMRSVLFSAALAALVPGAAWGQSETFTVRVTVIAACLITAQDLNFGVYNSDMAKSASTMLNLKCTPGTDASVSLDGGSSGNPRKRIMQGPAPLGINYQLYTDAAHRDEIDNTRAVFKLRKRDNTGQTVVYTVYGEIPPLQVTLPGTYIDTIRVTVEY